jgi:hypothetical protein
MPVEKKIVMDLNLVGIYRHLVDVWLHFDHSGDRPRLLDWSER